MTTDRRVERDSMGEVRVPADALYGAQTQRAIQNFRIRDEPMPWAFLRAICLIKKAAAEVHLDLNELDEPTARAIASAADRLLTGEPGEYAGQFPISVYQTGSGTSTHMNVNEVLARVASEESGLTIHPNDDVNRGQSSNDVVPSAIRISCADALVARVIPALEHLAEVIEKRSAEQTNVVKTARTHLMDAVPILLSQEMSAWSAQIGDVVARLRELLPRLLALPLGGTAVGTGLNAHPEFARRMSSKLTALTRQGGTATAWAQLDVTESKNAFAANASQDTSLELSGVLKGIATTLTKIASDLRWMNSGPRAGIAEIELPKLQPGSSIMPGKVNPVIPEAVLMAAAQVTGNDATITLCAQSGVFQLNVMLPLIAARLLESLELVEGAARTLADDAIAGFRVHEEAMRRRLDGNPILVTALNPIVGYDRAAEIAARAYAEDRPVIDVAEETTEIPREELERLLDPRALTRPSPPS